MRRLAGVIVGALLAVGVVGADDQPDSRVGERKKAAEKNWEKLEIGEFAQHETKHFLVYAPKDHERRLRDVGSVLEKQYDTAVKALGFDAKEVPLPTKLVVYLLPGKKEFDSFVRRVEGRRVEDDAEGLHAADEEVLHVAARPGKESPSVEVGAAAEVAALLIQRRAGLKTPLPDWLLTGFGRATAYRSAGATPKWVQDDRKKAKALAAARSAKDVWAGEVRADEAAVLQASLADYLAYGGSYTAKFPSLVGGFKPGEGAERMTTEQALEAAGLTADKIASGWKAWVLSQK